jgi:hypothetical protein
LGRSCHEVSVTCLAAQQSQPSGGRSLPFLETTKRGAILNCDKGGYRDAVVDFSN